MTASSQIRLFCYPIKGSQNRRRVGIRSISDYSPFGVQLSDRTMGAENYRFGFQGQEHDDEVKGDGNSVNYTFRMHDPRLGRFFAIDPLSDKYPWNSTYAFSENKVTNAVELEGLESNDQAGNQSGVQTVPTEEESKSTSKWSNPYSSNKPSWTINIGEGLLKNPNQPGDPNGPSGPAVGALIGVSPDKMNYYSTAIWNPFGSPNDITEGNHNFGVTYNTPFKDGTFSLGLEAYKQKVYLQPAYFDFNIEAPGPLMAIASYRWNVEFNDYFDAGLSVGTGLGGVLTQARIPNYFPEPGGYSPGNKDNGRNNPKTTYYNGYKFQGMAGALHLKAEFSASKFSFYASASMTMYHYSNLKLPIGERSIPNYGIFGVIVGGKVSF